MWRTEKLVFGGCKLRPVVHVDEKLQNAANDGASIAVSSWAFGA